MSRTIVPLFAVFAIVGTPSLALADLARPPAEDKAEDKAEKAEDKAGSCSVSPEEDALLGLTALALLLTGAALRRRRD